MNEISSLNRARKLPWFKNRLLRTFIAHSLPLLCTVLMFGGGAMIITFGFVARSSEQEAHNQLEQLQAYYEIILTEMDSLNLMFSTSSEMMNRILHIFEAERLEWIDAYDMRMIRAYISSPVNARPFIDSIYVYLNNSQDRVLSSITGITTLGVMSDTGWYNSYISDGGKSEFWAEYFIVNENSREGPPKPILRICRTIYSITQPLGVIVLNLRADRLIAAYSSPFTAEGSFFIIRDKQGLPLLSTPGYSKISEEKLRREYAHFYLTSIRFGWTYEFGILKEYLYRLPRSIGFMTITLSLAACILGLFLSYKANQRETRFFKMEQDYLRVQKEAMEYRALQMQINPHFLNNTLETINWSAIALSNGQNDVSRMIRLLSRLLKYSMEISKDPGVLLKEEIAHAKYYLELQNIRFEGRFSADWHIDSIPEMLRVPKLIFQPILENSFAHGFRNENQSMKIDISIYRENPEKAAIVITDNGGGIDEAILKQLNADNPDIPEGAALIGLANIRKRIILFYKGNAEFTINSEINKGTSIRISVPIPAAANPSAAL
ncbi:hypothetical protein AGMMS50293_06790 [Spirochaetia bacterium]|nr:hypothetical protein AGMMS50293_06790 [Spirochaetia bacterium]